MKIVVVPFLPFLIENTNFPPKRVGRTTPLKIYMYFFRLTHACYGIAMGLRKQERRFLFRLFHR